jgi:hypothetical protein
MSNESTAKAAADNTKQTVSEIIEKEKKRILYQNVSL